MILSYRVMIFAAEIPKRLLFQLWAPQTECHRAPSYLREGRRLLDGGTAQRVRGKVWVFHSGLNWTFNFACLELRIRWGLEERCSSGVTTRSKAAVCKIILSDQKHLSQSSDPILGLWVNCGPRWIRLQDLASWHGESETLWLQLTATNIIKPMIPPPVHLVGSSSSHVSEIMFDSADLKKRKFSGLGFNACLRSIPHFPDDGKIFRVISASAIYENKNQQLWQQPELTCNGCPNAFIQFGGTKKKAEVESVWCNTRDELKRWWSFCVSQKRRWVTSDNLFLQELQRLCWLSLH